MIAKKLLLDLAVPILKNITSNSSVNSRIEARFRERLLELSDQELQLQSAAVMAELRGDKLQRSWRPHFMYLMMAMLFFHGIVVPLFNSLVVPGLGAIGLLVPEIDTKEAWASIPDNYWKFLFIAVGGYIGGRSAEKIVGNLKTSERSSIIDRITKKSDPYEGRNVAVRETVEFREDGEQ